MKMQRKQRDSNKSRSGKLGRPIGLFLLPVIHLAPEIAMDRVNRNF